MRREHWMQRLIHGPKTGRIIDINIQGEQTQAVKALISECYANEGLELRGSPDITFVASLAGKLVGAVGLSLKGESCEGTTWAIKRDLRQNWEVLRELVVAVLDYALEQGFDYITAKISLRHRTMFGWVGFEQEAEISEHSPGDWVVPMRLDVTKWRQANRKGSKDVKNVQD